MRINNSKTDYWVFIWMLALCVISFVLSIKKQLKINLIGLIYVFTFCCQSFL